MAFKALKARPRSDGKQAVMRPKQSASDAATAIDYHGMVQQELSASTVQRSKSVFSQANFPLDVPQHRVLPDFESAEYYPEFISEEEAAHLLQDINGEQELEGVGWTRLTKRRLMNLGGIPHPDGMFAERMPGWLADVCDHMHASGVMRLLGSEDPINPNQCLLNEYCDGKGISAHRDGPLYDPCAAILSLHGPALLQFYEKKEPGDPLTPVASVVLQARSMFVFRGALYEYYYHGIEDADTECVPVNVGNMVLSGVEGGSISRPPVRVSLTLRRVSHVRKQADDHLLPVEQDELRRRWSWWQRAISEQA